MEIERIQAETLKKILDLPTSTPYVGVLMETGIWPAMDQLNYATLMFYHSVINSEERLVTKIMLEQEATSRANTFTERVKKIEEVLGIDTRSESVKKQKKLEWKKLCKKKIEGVIRTKLEKGCDGTKLRFLRNDVWEEKDYLKMASGNAIQQIIRIRLNMTSQRMNYKAKYNNDFMCPLCKKEEDTTEHVLTFEEMPEHKYAENDLYDTSDAAKWAKIIQLFQTNEKLRWDQESHS